MMEISDEPTLYLLLKAGTDSAWDCCDFTIVYLSKERRQVQSGRLEAVKPSGDDVSFQSLSSYNISIGFYQPDEDRILSGEDLPEDNNWCFVELTETELEGLVPPDNVLVGHILAVFANGEARYRTYGKHTDKRFWTEKFPLQQILDILASHESQDFKVTMTEIIKTDGTRQSVQSANGSDFTLEEMQAIIGGYTKLVELGRDTAVVVNEEDKFIPLPLSLEASRIFRAHHPASKDFIARGVLVCSNN